MRSAPRETGFRVVSCLSMHLESHAGLGWLIGVLPAGSDRRLRAWCVTAAVLPDVDAVSFLFGPVAYGDYHHTFGHNVFLGAAVAGLAAWFHRDRDRARCALAAGLVAVSFALHLLADMKLSAYAVYLFWPFSREGYEFRPNLGIGAPINIGLVYGSFALATVLAAWRGVSPLEFISPRLDAIVLGVFRRRDLVCSACTRKCNRQCDACGAPVCLHHGRIGRGFRIACPGCAGRI